MPWDVLLGAIVLAAAVAIASVLVQLTVRFARSRVGVVEAMIQAAFLPEKRRWYIGLLSVEGSLFLLTAIGWSLGQLGVLPEPIASALVAALCLGGMSTVLALTWIGLLPTRLTDSQREDISREAPAFLQSLALAPAQLGPAEGRGR